MVLDQSMADSPSLLNLTVHNFSTIEKFATPYEKRNPFQTTTLSSIEVPAEYFALSILKLMTSKTAWYDSLTSAYTGGRQADRTMDDAIYLETI